MKKTEGVREAIIVTPSAQSLLSFLTHILPCPVKFDS